MNKIEILHMMELLKDNDKKSIAQRVDELCKVANALPHNSRKELVANWADEAATLRAIAENYMRDALDTDSTVSAQLKEAGARAYAQAELYSGCANRLKQSLCEPTLY